MCITLPPRSRILRTASNRNYREQELVSIRIREGVEIFENGVFKNCTTLQSVIIPGSVQKIGDEAFSGCTALSSVTINDGVIEIGAGAFSGCTSLTEVVLPPSVKRIQWGAFSGCTSLTEVVIPDKVKEIDYGSFFCCTSLNSIHIPKDIVEIGDYAFSGCPYFQGCPHAPRNNDVTDDNKGIVHLFQQDTVDPFTEIVFDLQEDIDITEEKQGVSVSNIFQVGLDREHEIIDIIMQWMNNTNYEWEKKNEFYTTLEFNRYSNWLNSAIKRKDAPSLIVCIANILKWGGIRSTKGLIPDFSQRISEISKMSTPTIDEILNPWENANGDRIASWSKILAAYRPGTLFIYDSRVAIALSQISLVLGTTCFWNLPSPSEETGQPRTPDAQRKQEAFLQFQNRCRQQGDEYNIKVCYKLYLSLLKGLAQRQNIKDIYRNYVAQYSNIGAAYAAIGLSEEQAIMAHLEKILFMQKDNIIIQ